MGQSFVQSAQNDTVATVSSLGKAFASNNTLNNLLWVGLIWDSASPDPTIDDTLGNAFVPIVGPTAAPGTGGFKCQIFAVLKCKAGANTITAHWGAPNPTFSGIYIHEETDSADRSNGFTLDQIKPGTGTSTNPASGNTPATTIATEIVVGFAATDAGVVTADATFNQRELGTNLSAVTEDKFITSTGAQNALFVDSTSSNWVALCATFFTAAVATGGLGVLPTFGSSWHPGRSPGLGGISSARFRPSNWWPYSAPVVVTFDPATMVAMEKHGNDPLILPPQVVASGMTPPEQMPT